VLALPSGRRTTVKDIISLGESLPVAIAGDSVTLVLADDIDVSRGDMLTDPDLSPRAAKALEARICWLSSKPLEARALPSARFVLKHTTRRVPAKLIALNSRIDVNTLEEQAVPEGLAMNDIAHVALALAQPIFVDPYRTNRATGSFILVDEVSNQTLAAGMIE
jgi:sulfate adenylyltransferase subunit 1